MATRAVMVAAAVAALTSGACGLQIDYSKVVPAPAAADRTIVQVVADWGMTSTPDVFWYGGTALDCGNGTGYVDSTGTCVGGDQLDGQIIVALTGDPGADYLNDADLVNLVHEMAHEASDRRGEGGCADHRCRWFRYLDGRDLLMGRSPVYEGGDVDIESFRIRSMEVQ